MEHLYQALGFRDLFLFAVLLAGLIVATILMFRREHRDAARWLYLFLAIIPLVVGMYATLEGLIIARFFSRTPEEFLHGQSLAIVSLWVGLAITTPFFIFALIMLNRTWQVQSDQGISDETTRGTQPGNFSGVKAPGSLVLAGLALFLPVAVVLLQLFVLPPTAPAQRIATWGMIGLSSLLVVLDHRRMRNTMAGETKIPWLIWFIGLVGLWALLFPLMFLFRRRYGSPNLFLPALVAVLLFIFLPMAMLAFGPLPVGSLTPPVAESPIALGHRFEIRLASDTPIEGFEQVASNQPDRFVYVSKQVLIDNSGVLSITEGVDSTGNSSLQFRFSDDSARSLMAATQSKQIPLLAIMANGVVVLAVPIEETIGANPALSFPDSESCRRTLENLTGRRFIDQPAEK